jgi:hypothetical protein
MWGDAEAITPPAMAHAFHRAIAGSELEIIARCGHLPPLERPREFAKAVTKFLCAGISLLATQRIGATSADVNSTSAPESSSRGTSSA